MTVTIDHALYRRLFAGVNEQGYSLDGWTRAPWTPELRAAEQLVIDAAVAGGMVYEHDPAGNLWITDPNAPADGLIAVGSHLDTVPKGGAFDGVLGVVGGLVAVLALRAAGVPNVERLAVISFADEEGSRFNTPCFGSRTMVGMFGDEVADAQDKDGISIRDVGPKRPADAAGLQRRIAAYVEIHVEQGLALDPAEVSLGIATSLSARGRWEWGVVGEANHAGTTPMAGRRDALVRAAEFVLSVQRTAIAHDGAVATVGRITPWPGGTNVVPGRCSGTLDVRALNNATRDAVVQALVEEFPDIAIEHKSTDDAAIFDPALIADLHAAANELGVSSMDLPSYAGHDAGTLALAGVPSVMIFTRSPNGISHNPVEHSDESVCLDAVAVLAAALAQRS
ncbi:MAG: Zn-dependent hydrolase [Thermoleophilia bacterium]|jgi:N-carbamoyl-L-amino-acid hydrolase|nr:Zn-dependent hydrolase [Thermoleophilia bacterium]